MKILLSPFQTKTLSIPFRLLNSGRYLISTTLFNRRITGISWISLTFAPKEKASISPNRLMVITKSNFFSSSISKASLAEDTRVILGRVRRLRF